MKLSTPTLLELEQILKEEFNLELDSKDLSKFAYSLVGLFDLMQKIEDRHKFQNHPSQVIDQTLNKSLDEKETK